MVFVHSRKDTGKTARQLAEIAGREGDGGLFDVRDHDRYPLASKDVKKSRWGGRPGKGPSGTVGGNPDPRAALPLRESAVDLLLVSLALRSHPLTLPSPPPPPSGTARCRSCLTAALASTTPACCALIAP